MYYNTNKTVDEFLTDYIFSPALSMITNSKCLKKRLSQNTFLYFDMYLYSAYAAHYVYFLYIRSVISGLRETIVSEMESF